jgi:hypothetical protein
MLITPSILFLLFIWPTDVEETDEIYRLIKVGERVPNEVLLSHILDSWGKPNRSLCKYLAKQMKEVGMCFCSFYVRVWLG